MHGSNASFVFLFHVKLIQELEEYVCLEAVFIIKPKLSSRLSFYSFTYALSLSISLLAISNGKRVTKRWKKAQGYVNSFQALIINFGSLFTLAFFEIISVKLLLISVWH